MKEKKIELKIKSKANRFDNLISQEIKSGMFGKNYNLAGEYSESGGIDLYSYISLISFRPNMGPLVKLNVKSLNIDENGFKTKLVMTVIKGFTYKMHKWTSLIISFIAISIAIYQMAKEGISNSFEFLIMPLAGILYYLFIDLIAEFSTDNLKNKVLKILKKERIEYQKL